MYVKDNYTSLRLEIDRIAKNCGRDPEEITLLPVSKTFPAETIQGAIDAGLSLFGENKVQEAKDKCAVLTGNYELHLIGHLQSNKAKDAVKLFSLIHSIDKASTARKLSAAAENIEKIQDILLQVNLSGESSKNGTAEGEVLQLFDEIRDCHNLRCLGLMTIGPTDGDNDAIRTCFAGLRELKQTIESERNVTLPHLSMGMSGDYKIAIEEGATMVRIGSAIFGKRDYQI